MPDPSALVESTVLHKFFTWALAGLTTVALAVIGAVYALQDRRISRLEDTSTKATEETPKLYRGKDDCAQICAAFTKSMDSLKASVDGHFNRLEEYIREDIKEVHERIGVEVGGAHERINEVIKQRKTCKCQEGE